MRKTVIGIALLLLNACAHAPVGSVKPVDYMGALRDAEAEVAAATDTPGPPLGAVRAASDRGAALQQLAVARSWVGDDRGAAQAFDQASNVEPLDPGQQQAGEQEARGILEQFAVENAVEAIVREARDRQIVILNEAHHVARHRAFALNVAKELRKLGFQYLAMETLAPDTAATMRRGYPVGGTGTYTREPFFGDYVRQAIAQGYALVAYEQEVEPDQPQASDIFASIEAREEAQARNLVDRIFREHPDARVLIHVGQQHVMKGEWQVGDRRLTWMAERLHRMTGIDPLCIDQANAGQQPRRVVRGLEALATDPGEPREVVLRDRKSGRYWPQSGSVDMQVIHVGNGDALGRPWWTGWIGERHRRLVPAKLMPRHGRRLIQAFIANESADAIPIDQVLVFAGQPAPMLVLPATKIRFAFQD